MKTYELTEEQLQGIYLNGNSSKNPYKDWNDILKRLSPSTPLKQLSDEEIKEFCKKMKKLYTSNFKHCEHTDNNALLLTKDLIAIALSGSPLKEEKEWSREYTKHVIDTVNECPVIECKYPECNCKKEAPVSQSDHINPIELQKAKDYDKLYKKIQSVYEKKTGDICDIGEIAATHFGFLV